MTAGRTLIALTLWILHTTAHTERILLSNPRMENNKRLLESMLDSNIQKRQTISRIEDNDISLAFGFRGTVSVGSPGQPLTVLFDTGSTQFWVQSVTCTNCSGTRFNRLQSSSFVNLNKAAKTIQYVDGTTVRSQLISETVSINNLSQNNYTMSLAVSVNEPTDLDGVMGFGFSRDSTAPTFISQIFTNDPSLSPIFSYFIDKTDVAGALTIGGIDQARFSGPLATESILSLEESPFWELSMSSLEVGGSKMMLPGGMTSIFDTGSSLAVFSYEMAEAINQKLGIPPSNQNPGWSGLPCPNGKIPKGLPDLVMTFGSVRLRFTPKEYIFLQANSKMEIYCVSGILGVTNLDINQSIIGNVLLRRYYTVFDMKNRKLGFATCNRKPTAKLSIIESDLSLEIKGIADPSDVNWEVSSKSTNGAQSKHHSGGFLMIIFIILNMS